MKALTVWQPWASLIMGGWKPYEFRRWPAPRALRGTRIVIHAGARPVRRAEIADLIVRLQHQQGEGTGLDPAALERLEAWHASPGQLPLAAGLGTALLGEPLRATELYPDSDRADHHICAWPLSEIEVWAHPEPRRGAQGFWQW